MQRVDPGKETKTPGEGQQKQSGDDLKDEVTAATKVKAEYQKVEQNARQLITQIETNKAYSSLNNPQNLGMLKELYAELTGSVTEFGQESVGGDQVHQKQVRECYIEVALKAILQTLRGKSIGVHS